MASVTRNLNGSADLECKESTRLLPACQVWMISENASPSVVKYLLSGDPLGRENALLEIEEYIEPTPTTIPKSLQNFIHREFFAKPPCYDIEDSYNFIKSSWLNKNEQASVCSPREVKIWRKSKSAIYWKEAHTPGLIRLVSNSDDEASRRSLYVSPIYVTSPADTENSALMTQDEIDGFNKAYVDTALKLSRIFETRIIWTRILLNPNVEDREFIPINPIEVNADLDASSLKAFGGMLALSKADPTCDGFILPALRAAIQKKPSDEPLDGEEFEIVHHPDSDDQASKNEIVDLTEV